jgi:ribulose-5-phosphate 4-epimerase/fuculose-1-phosphate aldolase
MNASEQQIRRDLAACYRLVALHGWDDLIFTHISARLPDEPDHFLINPYGMLFEEITASSLVKINLQGQVVGESPFPVNPAGFTIHSAIHEVRHDANCVMHLHTIDGTAVSSDPQGLLPLNQTAQLLSQHIAYHDYEGVALDHSERPRLQKDLGHQDMMLLRNHGTLTVGRSCADAFLKMYMLERACSMQARTLSMLKAEQAYPTESAVIAKNSALMDGNGATELAEKLVWPAMMRKLQRTCPDFAH